MNAVFHGHAHAVSSRAGTRGVPVYNVAMPVLKKRSPDKLPVKFIEIDPDSPTAGDDGAAYDGMERRRTSDGNLAATH